ncbi:MAG: response regulator [Candidatus Cyclonatronum sp.]|uniref:hypothetical protein n=1 Tax=Cyclonatronum sp. TaxID=3024185 RepID=UPI0025BED88D|nr:hypothetical protein [Cyclonatronum sp.]MCH8485769.1 response regulator [Cyclonatronum sp.]
MDEILISIITLLIASFINFLAKSIYNRITGANKSFLWKNKFPSLEEMKSSIEFEDLKKRVRILVIDDEDGFPVNIFQSEGYNIEKWSKVNDYGKLERGYYDLIVLDIKGVASHISSDDGLGVLDNLKKSNPSQIIIAHSQHSFDLGKSRFWELADENIPKPCDFLKMKSIIDNLILSKYTPSRYFGYLEQILKNNKYSTKQINKINNKIAEVIRNNTQPNWPKIIESDNPTSFLVKQVSSIGNTLIRIFK